MGNFIIHQEAKQYEWSGECYLSIKSFYKGRALYKVQSRHYEVTCDNYLILDNCTSYKLSIDSAINTESFCVFFEPAFVSEVCNVWASSPGRSLELSFENSTGLTFYERNYRHGDNLSKALLKARHLYPVMKHDRMWISEMQHNMLEILLDRNVSNLKAINDLKPVKAATREELYRRIYYARDFIDANYCNDISIEEIAHVAMLSPTHLLRNYKAAFGLSPHKYIINRRMALAKKLILDTELTVLEVMERTGYSSLSNFSWIFRLFFGRSPVNFRKK